jgi:hypothetical protein
MAAKCHVASKEYEQALEVLNWDEEMGQIENKNLINSLNENQNINFVFNGRNVLFFLKHNSDIDE